MSVWYFPSNKNVFDMVTCLHERDEIDQPCTAELHVGDKVFIYVTEPFGQIMYFMEITAIFPSFEQTNKGRWAKYAGRNVEPRKGPWFRMKILDYANPKHYPLQCGGLRAKADILTSNRMYRLSKIKVDYLLEEFANSKK